MLSSLYFVFPKSVFIRQFCELIILFSFLRLEYTIENVKDYQFITNQIIAREKLFVEMMHFPELLHNSKKVLTSLLLAFVTLFPISCYLCGL